jgi:hypothetical protein
MSNTTIGSGAGTGTKKETVYSGPSPQPRQGTVSSGPPPAPAGGTVYGGLAPGTNGGMISKAPAATGTVYDGPGTGGTVYNPARQNPAARPVQGAANTGGAKGGAIFFVIAAFSALNTLLILAHAPFVMAVGLAVTRVRANGDMTPVLVLNAIVLGVFVALGVFAMKGSKAAFLVGLLLYAGDTALLLLSGDAALHIPSILVHGFFLYGIVKAFRKLGS